MKAYLNLQSFNHNSSFSTWLTRISINTAFMMLRRKRVRRETVTYQLADSCHVQPHLEIADRRANPEEHYLDREKEARLRVAISHLPSSYRLVIELREQTDGSLKEIAGHTGITIAATKSRIMRATKALRASIS
jgi:RNA polymerase sigma-70 factor (ECF subfamily)